jgi:hypothetical protein
VINLTNSFFCQCRVHTDKRYPLKFPSGETHMDIDGNGHVPGEDNTEVISSLKIRIISVLKNRKLKMKTD